MSDFQQIVNAARAHYENLKTDIENSKDRIEHIRLTALAQEAHNLLIDLQNFSTGLVYSHTGNVQPEIKTFNEPSTPLDLPEFKSPYTPPATGGLIQPPLRLE
jgi:hypothetical protein